MISLLYFLLWKTSAQRQCVSGGRGIWQRKLTARIPLSGLNPLRRGNVPARPLYAVFGGVLGGQKS
ncbi:MAG: hypothetical protein OT477_09770 [Chloroflexi bacterium]|nr:hypothetical protein [Chloroflexota bacterium]